MREIGSVLMQALAVVIHTPSEIGIISTVQLTRTQLMERLQLRHAESMLYVGIMCRSGPL